MKKLIILISVLAMMSVNSVLGAVKAVPIQGTTFDTNNSQETENSNINLKIIDVFVAGDDTKVKAILEDKTNVSQYTKVHLMSNAESNIDFYLLENGEWRHLSNNSSFISSTGDRVEKTEYYNKELTFSIPKYIMIPNTLASFPTLSKPINGHFKLKYYDYEVEFDVDNNTLVNNLENNSKDENNSIKNANVSLKIIDASMSEYNSIRVKAVLEDKSNPAQYKEFQFTASFGGVNLELFQILENNEWKNLDSYPIDRYGAPTGTTALVDMYCEYNSDLIFYLPRYIAGNPSRELPNPVSGHFKLKYCGYEAEFDIKNNTLSKDNNNLLDANLNSMSADEIGELGKKYYYGEGVPQNYDLARQYFELSAAKGSAKALYNIGSMIWYGYSAGTKEQARQYFEMAGDNGCSEGYYAIGWNILMGKLEGTNEEGRQYLERAATLGNEKAKQILN